MSDPAPPSAGIDPSLGPIRGDTPNPSGGTSPSSSDAGGPAWPGGVRPASPLAAAWATLTRRRTGPDPRMVPGPGEELSEHIPWERLTIDPGPRRPWMSYAVASLALVALVAGVWLLRGPKDDLTVITLPPTVAASLEPPAPAGGTEPEPQERATPEPAPPEPPQVVPEADLLAYVPVPAISAAEARAEWFVSDYFSTTDPRRDEKLAGALGGGTVAPAPQGPVAYVDWVRALRAELVSERTVTVTVLYRMLVSDGEDFVTGPVQAVSVEVVVGPDGGTVVTGLPHPVPLPDQPPVPERLAVDAVEAPPAVAAAAFAELDESVRDPQVVRAVHTGSLWALWIEATDGAGLRWTYEVTVAVPPGETVPAPGPGG